MSTKPDERASESEELEEEEAEGSPASTIEALAAREDVDGLLARAKAHRAGTDGVPKDLQKCLECYRAAAKLGSAEAEYAIALFSLSGGLVPQDLKEGAARLRVAADGGYLPAKVYLANLYDLGVHYAADPAKADVWYRSAARAAGIDDDPTGGDYARKMAELGCTRFALGLASDLKTPPEERERFVKKAKAYGYQLKIRKERDSRVPTPPAEADPTDAPAARAPQPATGSRAPAAGSRAPAPEAGTKPEAVKGDPEVAREAAPKPRRPGSEVPKTHALMAFVYETLFVGASMAAGYLAHLGALELLQRGAPVPVVGHRIQLIIPIALAVLGVLPSFLMYKAGTVVRAVAVGGIAGGAGYALWETGRALLFATRGAQSLVFGIAGFLATLLVLGLLGGVKPPRRPVRRILT
jgi:hypothetical protein